jgi:circadian clock protein KaiB
MVASALENSEGLTPGASREVWRLRLYVRGKSPLTDAAIKNVRTICTTFVPQNHELEVIDIDQQPDRAADEQIIALPTLVRLSPAPVRRVIGDLGDQQRVLVALNLQATTE